MPHARLPRQPDLRGVPSGVGGSRGCRPVSFLLSAAHQWRRALHRSVRVRCTLRSSREVGKVFQGSVQRRAAAEGGQGSGAGAASNPRSLANAAGVHNPPTTSPSVEGIFFLNGVLIHTSKFILYNFFLLQKSADTAQFPFITKDSSSPRAAGVDALSSGEGRINTNQRGHQAKKSRGTGEGRHMIREQQRRRARGES